MNSSAINYIYRYPFASNIDRSGTSPSPGLSLATCSVGDTHPYFFDGKASQPKLVADMLLVLSEIVRTHFFLPIPTHALDPVVTSNDGVLRFEGFSACCGVYARCDLTAEFFDTEIHGRGTTNVDFNEPMRSALRSLSDQDKLNFQVGKEEFSVTTETESIIEKKVKLPLRWIKGFSETQVYQTTLKLQIEIAGPEALMMIRGIKKTGSPKQPSYIIKRGKTLSLSQRQTPGAVKIVGLHRLKPLTTLIARANKVKIWSNPDNGVQAWVLEYTHARFLLMVSPEPYRGFSGEGQALSALATLKADANVGDNRQQLLANIRAHLTWQNQIDTNELVRLIAPNLLNAELDQDLIKNTLSILGASGLAGYDLTSQQYFHRELPFELDMIESLQPRLLNAQKLIDNKKISLKKELGNGEADFLVAGTDVKHFVSIHATRDTCTCPWYSKYQGQRGPCKHILAANLFIDNTQQHDK